MIYGQLSTKAGTSSSAWYARSTNEVIKEAGDTAYNCNKALKKFRKHLKVIRQEMGLFEDGVGSAPTLVSLGGELECFQQLGNCPQKCIHNSRQHH